MIRVQLSGFPAEAAERLQPVQERRFGPRAPAIEFRRVGSVRGQAQNLLANGVAQGVDVLTGGGSVLS